MTLTNREKAFIAAGGLLLLLMLAVLGFGWLKENLFSLDHRILSMQTDARKLQELGQKYSYYHSYSTMASGQLSQMVPEIEGMLREFNLLSTATLTPTDENIKNQYMKRVVSVNFREVPMGPVLAFLQKLESGSRYRVEKFSSRKAGSGSQRAGYYFISLQLSGFEKK